LFGSAVPGALSAAVAATVPLCSSSQLNAFGGRQGEATTAAGILVFVNISAKSCTLAGVPRLLLVNSSGVALSRILYKPPSELMTWVTLPPKGEAELITNWANWCHAAPGLLKLRVTLPHEAGSLIAPFNGPPAHDLVPVCINKSSASQFVIVGGYQRSNFQSGSSTKPAPVSAKDGVVTGSAVPCIGPVIPATTAWKGFVTLTRNEVVVAKQQVTEGHYAYVLRAVPGTYLLSLKGIGGWSKVIHLGIEQKLRIPNGPFCL
jgi:hypothetical protein